MVILRAVPLAEVRAMLAGAPVEGLAPDAVVWHPEYPQADTLDGCGMLLAAHEAMGLPPSAPAEPAWWMHQIVADGEVVGDIGFHGPPTVDGEQVVEIGYNVVPARQRRGLATQACAMIIEVAWRDGADVIIARTEPDNGASQKVLLRNGFRAAGEDTFRLERPR